MPEPSLPGAVPVDPHVTALLTVPTASGMPPVHGGTAEADRTCAASESRCTAEPGSPGTAESRCAGTPPLLSRRRTESR
ncbi:hypothetical protein SAMN04488546_0575 [Geodermatophilus poikilotrophus]|uniref:Uncharacterized protein n=1 Tax=Geodermatophilus poikilotrophus TaxID=1333667 RepID=A0A1H9ZGC1_9ACTN|nr:hypothetical protein SAMN04488546_0575 [Geodermatophilus poikilotrophus]